MSTTSEIAGFMDLQFSDQKDIKDYLSGSKTIVAAGGSETAAKSGDFVCEYAKSNRSKCKLCDEVIEVGTVRLGAMEVFHLEWMQFFYFLLLISRQRMDRPPFLPVPQWHHVKCFASSGKWYLAHSSWFPYARLTFISAA